VNGSGPSFPYGVRHPGDTTQPHGIPHHAHVMLDPKHTDGTGEH